KQSPITTPHSLPLHDAPPICVLANRLSENGRYSVCLLEAGPPDRNMWIHIPIGYGKTMFNKKLNWGFYTDPDPNMLDRKIYWPRDRKSTRLNSSHVKISYAVF